MDKIQINSEIGQLEAVLLHRPGEELERIVPSMLADVLFEDIPWLRRMQAEHDAFADKLRARGVEVFYVEDLLRDVVEDNKVRKQLIYDLIEKNPSSGYAIDEILADYLLAMDKDTLTGALITGLWQKELDHIPRSRVLSDYINQSDPFTFYVSPLPNLYFMRDPAACIGDRMALCSMATKVRKRESLYLDAIYRHHPLFAASLGVPHYQHDRFFSIEGGDILVLSDEVVAVGCSQRTQPEAVEILAGNLFQAHPEMQSVLAVKIPADRAFMHLDTVFTMVDYDKFVIYPGILDQVEAVMITRGAGETLNFKCMESLDQALRETLHLPAVKLIESGGGNPVVAAREQWNDSTNTLAIAPGVIVAYGRNEVSNAVLAENGIEIIEIESSELVRGRGGPRCMTMPLKRANLT